MKTEALKAGSLFGFVLALGLGGCTSGTPTVVPIIGPNAGPDPAAANLAPAAPTVNQAYAVQTPAPRVLGARAESSAGYQQGEDYQNQQSYPGPGYQNGYGADPNGGDQYDESQIDAGQAALEADQPPPPLPVYDQPPAPEQNDLWTPGYWNYGTGGYYWVPGAWVAAPYMGALWTPPYWGYVGHRYRFHGGYWGSHVGFYGGIPYGFGYTGYGYEGGYWHGNDFYYNRFVNRVNDRSIRFVYDRNVAVFRSPRVSYNGGPGGYNVRPRPAELAVFREQRTGPMAVQLRVQQAAASNRGQFFSENRGRPGLYAHQQGFQADRGISAPGRSFSGQGRAGEEVNRGGFGGQAVQQQRNQEQERNNLQGQRSLEQQRGFAQQQHGLDRQQGVEQQRGFQQQRTEQDRQGAEQQRGFAQQQQRVEQQGMQHQQGMEQQQHTGQQLSTQQHEQQQRGFGQQQQREQQQQHSFQQQQQPRSQPQVQQPQVQQQRTQEQPHVQMQQPHSAGPQAQGGGGHPGGGGEAHGGGHGPR